jgi:flavin-dependent dehydrogenase
MVHQLRLLCSHKKTDTRLRDGAQVAVIGGGPAGCFFALHLLRYARLEGIRLQVTVFELRDFSQAGPRGCGKCAGLLSSNLQRNLRSFGLSLPAPVIQNKIDSYVMYLADESVEIFSPVTGREITSVYRSRGPRLAPLGREVSFDEWLLKEAEQAGTHIVRMTVQKLIAAERPIVQVRNQDYPFDLVVLANGVNARRLPISDFNYQPPRTKMLVQDELNQHSGDSRQVHIYFDHPKGAVFGAVVPKGSMTNISLLGRNLGRDAVGNFMAETGVGQGYRRLCGCHSRITVSIARGYYADRFVAVGDAATSRLYKDGIGTAFETARRAAYTAIYHGIRASDFRCHYAPLCRMIALDNFFGRLLFNAWSMIARTPTLVQLWLRVLEYELALPNEARRCRQALWNMFTGDDNYRRIFFSLVHPRVLWLLFNLAWQLWVRRDPGQALRRR